MLTPTKIRQLRQERGWSQQKLADNVLVNRTTVVRWETNGVKPLPAIMVLLEDVLEVKEERCK